MVEANTGSLEKRVRSRRKAVDRYEFAKIRCIVDWRFVSCLAADKSPVITDSNALKRSRKRISSCQLSAFCEVKVVKRIFI